MQVQIRTKGVVLTDGSRSRIEQRLGFALKRFSRNIRAVLVWLGEVNDRESAGIDKCCRMAVELTRGTVVLEERATDLYKAIDQAARRAGRKIEREIRWATRLASPRPQVM